MIWEAIPFFSSLSSFFLLQHTLCWLNPLFPAGPCVSCKRPASRREAAVAQRDSNSSCRQLYLSPVLLPSSALILFSHPSLLKPGPPPLLFPSSLSSSKPPTAELICSWTSDWMPGCRGDGVSSFKSWLEPQRSAEQIPSIRMNGGIKKYLDTSDALKINLEGKITNKISLIAQLFLLYGNEIK